MLDSLRDLYRRRALVAVLTGRELKARYRGSLLGFFWSLLSPLIMLAVYTVVFQVVFPNRSLATRPYAVFLFTGLLPWSFFSAGLVDAAGSLVTHGALLKKILFPSEILPLVAVLSQAVHFLLGLPVLLLAIGLGASGLLDARVVPGLPLLQLPLLFLLQSLLVLGLGLLLAALAVHFRDVRDLLATLLPLWFFATPILYTLGELPGGRLRSLLAWNPIAPLFSAWHDALFFGRWVPARTWGAILLVTFAACLAGYALYDRLRDSFPEAV